MVERGELERNRQSLCRRPRQDTGVLTQNLTGWNLTELPYVAPPMAPRQRNPSQVGARQRPDAWRRNLRGSRNRLTRRSRLSLCVPLTVWWFDWLQLDDLAHHLFLAARKLADVARHPFLGSRELLDVPRYLLL